MPFQEPRSQCGLLSRSVVLIAILVAVIGAMARPFAAEAFDAARVEPSVYKIYTYVAEPNDQYTMSSGTGFLVSGRRHVITNFHVVENGERYYIAIRTGREVKLVEAELVARRPNVDLALLEAREDLPGRPLELGEYEPEKLADVIAIGFPGAANLNKETVAGPDARGVPLTDLDSTVTAGSISRMTFTNLKISDAQVLSARTVQHNAAINPGNSGGPLFDACGLVVGVNTLQGLNSQGLFFSIHASEVGRFLRESRIAFSTTSRPCAPGLGLSIVPFVVALSATLALGAIALMLHARGRLTILDALPRALARGRAHETRSTSAGSLPAPTNSKANNAPVLRPEQGGAPLRLDERGAPRTVGRGTEADIIVADDTVSKVHARLAYEPASGRLRVNDLGSSNGTFVDGVRISDHSVEPGSVLCFGTVEFTFALEKPASRRADVVAGAGWMLSGFDPSGRALQFELRLPQSGAAATWTFGRDPARATFVIDDVSVSAVHAEITSNPGEAPVLRDLGSMNGTRLDGESIGNRAATLSDTGHEITFGLAHLRVSRLSS